MYVQGVGQHFTIEQFKEVLSQMPLIQAINWIGDGEPLCNPQFQEMIAYAAKKHKRTTFTTNGTLVTQAHVDFWKAHRVVRVSISMDSPNGDRYEKMRPGASFGRMVNAARMIHKAGIYLQTSIAFFGETLPEIIDYVKLSRDVGAQRIYLIRPHFVGTVGQSEGYTFPKNDVETHRILNEARDIAKDAGMVWYEPWYPVPYFRSCMWPFISPYVNIGGNIQACCYVFGRDRVEHFNGENYEVKCSNYDMGNILTEDFGKIWRGEAYGELRRMIMGTEHSRGTTVNLEKLKELKQSDWKLRFGNCANCLWRWGLAC